MSQSEKKKSTKVPTNKECGACLCRGYDLSSTYLGGGAMGRVFLARPGPKAIQNNTKLQVFFKQSQSPKVAIKIIYVDKGAGKVKSYIEELAREVENLNTMFGNRNIMQLLDVFICFKRIFLVTEYVAGGSLKQVYRSIVGCGREKNVMEEGLARYYFKQLVKGVDALHNRKIAHRDLKLDNILITDTGRVKIGDFGFSVKVADDHEVDLIDKKNGTFCGTPVFMAPEVLRCTGVYQAINADIWSLGVILYVLTNSQYPFEGRKMRHVLRDIKKKIKNLYFREGLSKDCRDITKKMLQFLPEKRTNVKEIQKHHWFKKPVILPENYSKQETQVNHNALQKIKKEPRFQLEATYVRSYLLQRAKLLRSYQKKLRKRLPKSIYKDFGLPICIPRQEGVDESLQIETWRLMSLSICSKSEEANSKQGKSSGSEIDSNLAASPGYDLSLSCVWASDRIGSTVGVVHVKRIVKVVSILDEWAHCRYDNNPPITELDKCIQLYNTVDLDVQRSWPLPYPIPRPEFVYCHATNSQNNVDSDIEKLTLVPANDVYIDPSYLFVRYNPGALQMNVGDFQIIQEKKTSTLEKAIASKANNAIWPTTSENQEELKLQVSDLITRIITKTIDQVEQDITPIRNISLTMAAAIKDDKDNVLRFSCKYELLCKSVTDSNNASILTFSSHMEIQEKINSNSLKIFSNTLTHSAAKNEVGRKKIVSTKTQVTMISFATKKNVKEFDQKIKQCLVENVTHTTAEEIRKYTQLLRTSIKHKKKLALDKRRSIHKTPCFKIQEEKLPASSVVISTTDEIERRQKQKQWRQNLRKKLQTENITVKNEQMNMPTTPLINGLMDICDKLIEIKTWIEKNEAVKTNLLSYASTIMKKTHNSKKEKLLSYLLSYLLEKTEQSENNEESQIVLNQNHIINHFKRKSRNSTSSSNSPSYIFDEQDNNNKSNSVSVTNSKLNSISHIKTNNNKTSHERPLSETIETEPPKTFFRRLFRCFKKPKPIATDDSVTNKKPKKKNLFRRCFCIC